MKQIISVVSGKGGAGKSLLTAVLGRALAREGERVLLIDMDIFVRGLTVLLYSFSKPDDRRNSLAVSDLLGVFTSESAARAPKRRGRDAYLIHRFFECDVLPAVANISTPLDYDDKNLSEEKFCEVQITRILNAVFENYDYVLLDNRAGMDSLISASCRLSDFVLTVAEDDPVGRQTNDNLVDFLRNKKNVKKVYTIINKGRGISSYSDLKIEKKSGRRNFSTLGVVPFDMDVLQEFGTDRFWSDVFETLYFKAIIDSWNELSQHEPVKEISESKYKFPPAILMRKSEGRFLYFERILRLYGMLVALGGGAYYLFGSGILTLNTTQGISLSAIALGVAIFYLSSSGVIGALFDRRRNE